MLSVAWGVGDLLDELGACRELGEPFLRERLHCRRNPHREHLVVVGLDAGAGDDNVVENDRAPEHRVTIEEIVRSELCRALASPYRLLRFGDGDVLVVVLPHTLVAEVSDEEHVLFRSLVGIAGVDDIGRGHDHGQMLALRMALEGCRNVRTHHLDRIVHEAGG